MRIDRSCVRSAKVFDIRSAGNYPRAVVLDTNVLVDLYCPAIKPGQRTRTPDYVVWCGKAKASGTEFCVATVSLLEVARTVAAMEIASSLILDGYSTSEIKPWRFAKPKEYEIVKGKVETILGKIRKDCRLLLQPSKETLVLDDALSYWKSSNSDFPDAFLVGIMHRNSINVALTDDADFVTFGSIQMYTASPAALSAARAAGKIF